MAHQIMDIAFKGEQHDSNKVISVLRGENVSDLLLSKLATIEN